MVHITDRLGSDVELGHRTAGGLAEFQAPAVVAHRRDVADGVVEIVLRRADGDLWPTWSAGSHVDLLLPGGLVRQYSLCGDVDDRLCLRLGILREPESRGGSAYVHDQLTAGSQVEVRGPRNAFELNEHERFVFIAGGIGVTPILPMVQEAIRRSAEWELHYGGRTRASMGFLEELLETGGDVQVYPQDEVGFIPLADILSGCSSATGVYACGPGPMLEAIEAFKERLPPGCIHMERFAVNEADLIRADDRPIQVELAASGLTFDVAADESILSVVERHGIGVLSSCRVGTCGTCETPVLQGDPDHRDSVLDDEDRERNDCMMICVSRARSSRLVLDL